jgi:hypothetical protein
MKYRLTTKEGRDSVIALLAKQYPACFFAEPKLRRPLKETILADLLDAGLPLTIEEIVEAVHWYRFSFGYQYALQAGTKRVDLTGKEAGTVTPTEQRAAELYIAKRREEMQARDLPPAVKPPIDLHKGRKIPDHALRNITVFPAPLKGGAKAQVDDVPPAAMNVSLSSARKVDADEGDRQDQTGSTKKRRRKVTPPCPTCGADSQVIATVQVKDGAVVRTRHCLGQELHVFKTKEVSIPL